jgi:hypothetical protein
MNRAIVILIALGALLGGALTAAEPNSTEQTILTLEKKAMDGFGKGNPDAAIALIDSNSTFLHADIRERLVGQPAIKALYESFRGQPLFDSYEIEQPKVQVEGDAAVLTYILVRKLGSSTTRWNGTQVYLHKPDGWRIIHSHWSVPTRN